MKSFTLSVFFALLLSNLTLAQGDFQWPVWPDSSSHILSAHYGTYLGGTPPWMHSGLDIRIPVSTPVYAVKSGYVKTITAKYDHYSYWRIVIGDEPGTDSCEAFLYAHMFESSLQNHYFDEYIEAGTKIGEIVDWPYHPGTESHLHFSRIRYAGDSLQWAEGQDYWVFIANPIDFLTIDNDTLAPVLEPAHNDSLFAFCRNESYVYFAPGTAISGDVDIICRGYDQHNFFDLKNTPHHIDYKIDGDSSLPWMTAISFTDQFGMYDSMTYYIHIIYQFDFTCNTQIIYDPLIQKSYYILTNSDGNLRVEPSDAALCWQTPYFHNGEYWVHVRMFDASGNVAEDSMTVWIDNAFALSGTVTLQGGDAVPEGTLVMVLPDGDSTYTDATGAFAFDSIGGSYQTIAVSRSVYVPQDSAFLMTQDTTATFVLQLGEHICGDANGDGSLNVGDAVYIVMYVFKGGVMPDPECMADANHDGRCNIGDAVYLISYIFKGGDAPIPGCCDS
ncbi:MAG: peptidoglycan DD-metalloendopeptidase family protein [Candidatus Zixiibacteriota bacterium]